MPRAKPSYTIRSQSKSAKEVPPPPIQIFVRGIFFCTNDFRELIFFFFSFWGGAGDGDMGLAALQQKQLPNFFLKL
jgi:hypothetical protein